MPATGTKTRPSDTTLLWIAGIGTAVVLVYVVRLWMTVLAAAPIVSYYEERYGPGFPDVSSQAVFLEAQACLAADNEVGWTCPATSSGEPVSATWLWTPFVTGLTALSLVLLAFAALVVRLVAPKARLSLAGVLATAVALVVPLIAFHQVITTVGTLVD